MSIHLAPPLIELSSFELGGQVLFHNTTYEPEVEGDPSICLKEKMGCVSLKRQEKVVNACN